MLKFLQSKKLLFGFSIAILFASVLQVSLNLIKLINQKPLIDFQIYTQVVRELLVGKNPYQYPYVQSIGGVPFNYPPGSILFFLPFSLFDPKTAEIIFTLLSFLTFIVSFYILRMILSRKIPLPMFMIILAFAIQTFPFKFTLTLGQVNNFVLLFIISALFLYQKNRKILSALFLTLASSLKLFPLGLLLVFVIKKDFKYVLLTCIFFLGMNLFNPSLFIGYFFNILPSLLSLMPDLNFYNQSTLALFLRLTSNPSLARILSLSILIIFLVKLIINFKKFPMIFSYFTLLAIISISGPFAWQHHLIFAYPFILVLFNKPLQLFLIWLFFAFHFKDPSNPLLKNPIIISYQTIGMIILITWALFMNKCSTMVQYKNTKEEHERI